MEHDTSHSLPEALDWNIPPANSSGKTYLDIADGPGQSLETKTFDQFYTSNGETIVLPAGPPRSLFLYRQELQDYGMAIEPMDPVGARHVHFLLAYMWDEFVNETSAFFTSIFLADDGVPSLEFEHLWMVFRPKDLVLVCQRDQCQKQFEEVFQFMNMEMVNDRSWEVHGYRIDYDGDLFGYTTKTYRIRYYYGYRIIKDLELVPMQYVADSKRVCSRLIVRGKAFTELHGQHHRLHNGIGSLVVKSKGHTPVYDNDKFGDGLDYRHHMATSRIMVDRKAFKDANPSLWMKFTASQKVFTADDGGANNMTSEELIICSDVVYGYSLRDNAWGRFHIDNMQQIDLDSCAFDELILQSIYKDHVRSLVQVHEDTRLQFDDFIKGKGRGVVFLFYGEPGTGKTLTAGKLPLHAHLIDKD
ncbi:uncharacterized protein PG998_002747 [Apiospora kogelbergensis]|uniref:uncharacterized protein n=1 Tax=Apiospora kogelbergensis TaxID=1337665 RepID=UPI0031327913